MPHLSGGKTRRLNVLPANLNGSAAIVIMDGDRKIFCRDAEILGPSHFIQKPIKANERWTAYIETDSEIRYSL